MTYYVVSWVLSTALMIILVIILINILQYIPNNHIKVTDTIIHNEPLRASMGLTLHGIAALVSSMFIGGILLGATADAGAAVAETLTHTPIVTPTSGYDVATITSFGFPAQAKDYQLRFS